DPADPFDDDERERLQVEALAKKFEDKYVGKKKRKDRMQDLIDIGFGYDETDPFIDNSEAYDELVPASLTTKLGGFYINTGTLQFRAASDSEGEADTVGQSASDSTHTRTHTHTVMKKRKKKDLSNMEKKPPKKNRVPKQGLISQLVAGGSLGVPEVLVLSVEPQPLALLTLLSLHQGGAGGPGRGLGSSAGLFSPPPLPAGLPAPLMKRIEDLRTASRQFDQEGRKKFFTLDMNNILLDIELQVQEHPPEVRSGIYSHMEAFVPCNKEALLKRLKKLSLNIQDDRTRTPLLKLKLAVCSVMPEQIAKYNMECMAKVAKQQSEEGDRNGSEDEDEEKPGKRVMGPRKKFVWDEKLRNLLCNLVRVKLSCYQMEKQCSLSVEDYLKAFLETEVKPLWPKGWMQARILLKESLAVHGHLTGSLVKRRVIPGPKAKAKVSVGGAGRGHTSSLAGAGLVEPPPASALWFLLKL
ncbi:unnamed protein product, partial [Tetraodon nigroviridis]